MTILLSSAVKNMSKTEISVTLQPKPCQNGYGHFGRFADINISKTDIGTVQRTKTWQKVSSRSLHIPEGVKNGHLYRFMAKNMSKWTPRQFLSQNLIKKGNLDHFTNKNVSKRTSLPLGGKYVKNEHLHRFKIKNGHLGRITTQHMSNTDTLSVS